MILMIDNRQHTSNNKRYALQTILLIQFIIILISFVLISCTRKIPIPSNDIEGFNTLLGSEKVL